MRHALLNLALLATFLFAVPVAVRAQAAVTTITGTLYDGTGQPRAGASLYVRKVIKNGGVTSTTSIRVGPSDASGIITFTVLRASRVWLEGPAYVGSTDISRPGGVEFVVPDSPTATLESLGGMAAVPKQGLTLKINDSLRPNLIGTLNVGAGITATESPTGELNLSVAQGAFALHNLTDVQLTSPSANQALVFNGSLWVNRALVKGDVGLGNVDNTSDAAKPISTATQAALDGKAAASDLTAEAATRAAADSSEASARAAADTTLQTNINTEASARASADSTLTAAVAGKAALSHTHTLSDVTDVGTAAAKNVPATGNATTTQVVLGSDTRLSDARAPTAHASTHAAAGSDPLTLSESQITNLVADLAGKAAAAHTHVESDVAGLVTDLAGKQAADSDLDAVAGLSTTGLVARTGTGTAATRTLTAGSSRVTVTNGSGLSGNPTVDLGTLTAADIPTLTSAKLSDFSTAASAAAPVQSVNGATGAVSLTLPATTAATTSNFLTAYNATTGAFTKAQPAFSDLSGAATAGQIPSTLNATTAPSFTVSGTAGAGYVEVPAQSSSPSTPSGGFRFFADSAGRLSWKGSNGFVRTFDGTANTADRAYVLPDAAGTVVLDTAPQTLTNKTLTTPKFATAGHIDDANGNELIKFPATVTSAVNEITVSNAATGARPTFSATGDDTNVDLALTAKGSGTVFVTNNLNVNNGYFRVGNGSAAKGTWANTDFRLASDVALGWSSSATATAANADTGLVRSAASVVKVTNGSTGAGVLLLPGLTFASLPASPVTGMHATVTDSSTATWGATITGGGSSIVHAFYNGTNWVVD